MSAIDPGEIALIVIAKEPLPGRCKTRLCPPLAPVEAAGLAQASLTDTLEAVAEATAGRRVLALDGRPGEWLPAGFEVVRQAAGGLGARLAGAFDAVGGPALLVGMDTPQLGPGAIRASVRELARDGVDAVLGPATDGGYWAIGTRVRSASLFAGVPMSSADTAAAQRARMRQLGLCWSELDTVRDFDTIGDASAVAGLCPGSRFARAFAALTWPVAV